MTRARRALTLMLLLGVAAGSGLGPSAALAARVSQADVEDEVMCVQCGRPLATSSGRAADDERQLIETWIEQGLTKAQIKQRLVAEYGERALVNDRSPIAAAAPWLAGFAGAASIALLLRRRRQRDDTPTRDGASGATVIGTPVSAADDARIDAELAAIDEG
ncbi:MAG: cytochrome c-type biogenesis protein CcmH [Patulibacter sp.]